MISAKPLMSMLSQSYSWYKHDTATYEDWKIDVIKSQYGLKHLI